MKIKYLDTNEIIEVTNAQQLANTKVRVTPETSEQIQEVAIGLGYAWGGVDMIVLHIKKPHLFFYEGHGCYPIMYGSDKGVFKDSTHREFVLVSPTKQETPIETDILNQIRAVEGASRFVETYDSINRPEPITVEALEKEPGWEIEYLDEICPVATKGTLVVEFTPSGIAVHIVSNDGYIAYCHGVGSSMQDLRTLEALING